MFVWGGTVRTGWQLLLKVFFSSVNLVKEEKESQHAESTHMWLTGKEKKKKQAMEKFINDAQRLWAE